MSKAFENLKNALKKIPGTGAKSAERMAIFLALENRQHARDVAGAIISALERVTPAQNASDFPKTETYTAFASMSHVQKINMRGRETIRHRRHRKIGAWSGKYHVLGGKLSPLKNRLDKLNLEQLSARIESDGVEEIILALSNDIEGEATCHYIQERIVGPHSVKLTE
ncbi:MAG: toprim domain-containing protein [Bacilli bacterium]